MAAMRPLNTSGPRLASSSSALECRTSTQDSLLSAAPDFGPWDAGSLRSDFLPPVIPGRVCALGEPSPNRPSPITSVETYPFPPLPNELEARLVVRRACPECDFGERSRDVCGGDSGCASAFLRSFA